jgi:hypothetical protein
LLFLSFGFGDVDDLHIVIFQLFLSGGESGLPLFFSSVQILLELLIDRVDLFLDFKLFAVDSLISD